MKPNVWFLNSKIQSTSISLLNLWSLICTEPRLDFDWKPFLCITLLSRIWKSCPKCTITIQSSVLTYRVAIRKLSRRAQQTSSTPNLIRPYHLLGHLSVFAQMLGLKTILISPKQQSVKPNTLESKRLICNLEHRSPFHGREPREPWSPLGTMSSHLHLPESHLLRLSSKLRAKLFKNLKWWWRVRKSISSYVFCINIHFFL